MSRARSRSTDWRRTDSGCGDGWVWLRPSSSVATSAAWRNRSNRSRAVVRSASRRSAWRAFSSMLRRSARAASESARRSRADDRLSRSRSSCAEGQLALLDRRSGGGDGPLGDLESAGVLVALGGQVVERLLEALPGPAGPAVGAADARLEAIAQGGLVAREVAQLVVPDRGGRSEEGLGRDAGQLGQDLVGEGRVGDRLALVDEGDRALRAGERLLERAASPCRPPRPARSRSRPTAGCRARRPTVAGRRGRRPRS